MNWHDFDETSAGDLAMLVISVLGVLYIVVRVLGGVR